MIIKANKVKQFTPVTLEIKLDTQAELDQLLSDLHFASTCGGYYPKNRITYEMYEEIIKCLK